MRNYEFKLSDFFTGWISYETTGKGFSGTMYINMDYHSQIIWKQDFVSNFKNTAEMIESKSKVIKKAYRELGPMYEDF